MTSASALAIPHRVYAGDDARALVIMALWKALELEWGGGGLEPPTSAVIRFERGASRVERPSQRQGVMWPERSVTRLTFGGA